MKPRGRLNFESALKKSSPFGVSRIFRICFHSRLGSLVFIDVDSARYLFDSGTAKSLGGLALDQSEIRSELIGSSVYFAPIHFSSLRFSIFEKFFEVKIIAQFEGLRPSRHSLKVLSRSRFARVVKWFWERLIKILT